MIKNQYIWKEDKILSSPAAKNSFTNSPILKCKIKTFISENNFYSKPKGYPDFKFHEVNISIEEYADKIVNGYAFCHLFNCPNGNYLENTEKKRENYVGANVIVFDLDDSPYDKEYYQENLTLKPSIIYNTFSHNVISKDKKTGVERQMKKIRFVYILDRVVFGEENYKALYDNLKSSIKNDIGEIETDNHQKNPTQFYYGTKYKDIIITNTIYSPIDINIYKIDINDVIDNNGEIIIFEDNEEDFILEIETNKYLRLSGNNGKDINDVIIYKNIFFEDKLNHSYEIKNKNTITLTNDTIKFPSNSSNKNIRTLIDKNYSQYKDLFVDMNFWEYFFVGIMNNDKSYYLNINNHYSIYNFIQFFENEYPIITNTGEVNDDGYTKFDENSKIIKIYYDGKKPRKYHPGEGRRNKLYSLGVQVKEIKPTVSLEQMVLSLVYYFDVMMINTTEGRKITKQIILQKAIEAYKQENYEGNFQKNTRKFKVDKTYCIQNDLKPKSYKNVVVKKINDENIGNSFDYNLSYEDNYKILNGEGVKCSLRRIKKFIKESDPEEYEKRKKKAGRKRKAQN